MGLIIILASLIIVSLAIAILIKAEKTNEKNSKNM